VWGSGTESRKIFVSYKVLQPKVEGASRQKKLKKHLLMQNLFENIAAHSEPVFKPLLIVVGGIAASITLDSVTSISDWMTAVGKIFASVAMISGGVITILNAYKIIFKKKKKEVK
jgi:hypothetical protein